MDRKYEVLRVLGWAALAGVVPMVLSIVLSGTASKTAAIIAMFLVLPAVFFGFVLTILHWKARYQGRHSDFWGVVLIIETSGFFKLVYFLRHLLPDMYGWGRYRKVG